MLNTVLYGEGEGVPLLIVHGLFGSARNWGGIARRLSAAQPVITVDQRNHGDSPRFATHSYPDMADDLAEVIRAHGGRADVMGHSMGGKAAMQLALTYPELVRRLIVADIAPVAYGHSQQEGIDAMRGLDLVDLSTRSEADRRLQLAVDDPALRAFFLQSLDIKAEPPRWKLNLDVLEAEMDKLVGWTDKDGVFEGPTFFLSGAESDYVKAEYRGAITAQFPKAFFAKIPGAGHWLHADKPKEFEAAVQKWLEATRDKVED